MRSAAEYGVTSTPFDKLRALSPSFAKASEGKTRQALLPHAVSPALVSSPRTPSFRGAPFKKEIPRGRKPIPASPPLKRGGHSTALVGFMVAALHSERAPDAVEYDGPGNTFTAWVVSTTLPLRQSPHPPRESRHTGRTTCSLLCTWLPALGGKVGQQPARSSHGGRLSAECLRRQSSNNTQRKGLRAESGRSFQVFSAVRTPPSALLI